MTGSRTDAKVTGRSGNEPVRGCRAAPAGLRHADGGDPRGTSNWFASCPWPREELALVAHSLWQQRSPRTDPIEGGVPAPAPLRRKRMAGAGLSASRVRHGRVGEAQGPRSGNESAPSAMRVGRGGRIRSPECSMPRRGERLASVAPLPSPAAHPASRRPAGRCGMIPPTRASPRSFLYWKGLFALRAPADRGPGLPVSHRQRPSGPGWAAQCRHAWPFQAGRDGAGGHAGIPRFLGWQINSRDRVQ